MLIISSAEVLKLSSSSVWLHPAAVELVLGETVWNVAGFCFSPSYLLDLERRLAPLFEKEGFDLLKKNNPCVFLLWDHTEEFLGIGVGVIKASLSFLSGVIHQPAAISVPARFMVKCLVTLALISLLGRRDLHLKLWVLFFFSCNLRICRERLVIMIDVLLSHSRSTSAPPSCFSDPEVDSV